MQLIQSKETERANPSLTIAQIEVESTGCMPEGPSCVFSIRNLSATISWVCLFLNFVKMQLHKNA